MSFLHSRKVAESERRVILTSDTKVNNMNSEAITQLLNQIQAGSEEALLQLHEQFATPVYSVAYRVLGNPQDAEEATQDVFLRLWDKANTFDPQRGNFTSWLLTIARRVAIDRLRKRERRDPSNSVSMDEEPYLWETTLIGEDMTELQRSLLSVLNQLPKEQQEAIFLAYFHGMSHSDISAYLGKPLGTVKSHIRLGMQKLREIWLN